MSHLEDAKPEDAERALREVGRFWQTEAPDAFGDLYRRYEHPFLAPCEFFSLRDIANGAGRFFGMTPQYLPFGTAVGEGGTYGFYVTPENERGRLPVLYWNDDEMYLRPVASDFEAFLRHCALVGRYETEDLSPECERGSREEAERREFARLLGLPEDLLLGPIPRNDGELYARLASLDPQDATSLCHLGCAQRARGDGERALDFFHRAGEAAPWFGDPYYLMADIYLERGATGRAVAGWWAVMQRVLPLCTRSWEWDLGADHPEADIYEVAADGLAQFCEAATPEMKADPLWRVVAQEDPYDPGARESLGKTLAARREEEGAEREFLSALTLCFSEAGRRPERLYAALIELYERAGRHRDAALARFDRELPRTAL